MRGQRQKQTLTASAMMQPCVRQSPVSVCHSGSSVLGHVTLGHLERAGLVQQVVVVHAHVLFPGPGSWK